MGKPAILEEGEGYLIYGVRTGLGNTHIYKYSNGQVERIETYNVEEAQRSQTRATLIEGVLEDYEVFRRYVKADLGHRWAASTKLTDWSMFSPYNPNPDLAVVMATHNDRDYDPLDDQYRFYIWSRDRGVAISDTCQTGLVHPNFRWHTVEAFLDKKASTFDGEKDELLLKLAATYSYRYSLMGVPYTGYKPLAIDRDHHFRLVS